MAGRGRWAVWLSSWTAWHWTLGAAQEPECVDLQTNCATLVASGYTCSMNLHSLIPSFPEGSLLCGVCPVTCGACGHGCTEALGLPPPPGTPEPEPESDSICGGPQAPWSTPIPGGGGAACACVNGYWSPAGHGHDCQQVLRCAAGTEYQSLPPSPTSNAHCLPLTTCRPDEVETTAPTATSDRVCTGVWEQVEDSTMGDPTCWNVETGFVYARCCNTEHSAVGDGSCWEGDFTFQRCCAQPPPPPPVPNTIGGGGTATILPNVPPPPPPVANCVGAWGECLWHPHVPHANMPEAVASGCLKRYTVITLARGGGEPCPVQDLTWTSCAPGEGRCPKSQLASGGSSKTGVSGSLKSGAGQPAASPASSGWLWLLLLLALVAAVAVAVRRRGGGGPCVELLTDGSTRRVKWCCCAESKREREESLLAEADALSEFDSRGRERNPLGASVGIAIAS